MVKAREKAQYGYTVGKGKVSTLAYLWDPDLSFKIEKVFGFGGEMTAQVLNSSGQTMAWLIFISVRFGRDSGEVVFLLSLSQDKHVIVACVWFVLRRIHCSFSWEQFIDQACPS
jgi:hypothetical protein